MLRIRNRYTGKTRQNKTVNFDSEEENLVGKLVNVKITGKPSYSH